MGLGIWSMHFVAMLALRINEPVWYDRLVTFASAVAAVIGCAIAFGILNRTTVSGRTIAAASVFMDLAIAAMHYTGMGAMPLLPASRQSTCGGSSARSSIF